MVFIHGINLVLRQSKAGKVLLVKLLLLLWSKDDLNWTSSTLQASAE